MFEQYDGLIIYKNSRNYGICAVIDKYNL